MFMGFGLGMTLVLLVTVAQLSTPPELIATASGLIISVRSLGGTIGIAICKNCPHYMEQSRDLLADRQQITQY